MPEEQKIIPQHPRFRDFIRYLHEKSRYQPVDAANPLDYYERSIAKTARYPTENALLYLALGLTGEAGEVANKIKKIMRDNAGAISEETRDVIIDELGDVQYYLTALSNLLGIPLSVLLQDNAAKVLRRLEEGKLHGSGDR